MWRGPVPSFLFLCEPISLTDTLTQALLAFTSSQPLQVAQWERICLPVQETWIQSLSQEDPLEKGMAIHSSILAWEIPWTEEPGRLQSMGLKRIGHN